MELFFKAVAVVLVTVILGLALHRQGKDFSLLLTVVACCVVVTAALTYLDPVISFFGELRNLGRLDSDMLKILMKAVGIGLLAEVASLICSDAGNAALGKTIQILAAAVVLWISLPLLNSLMALVQQILGEV